MAASSLPNLLLSEWFLFLQASLVSVQLTHVRTYCYVVNRATK